MAGQYGHRPPSSRQRSAGGEHCAPKWAHGGQRGRANRDPPAPIASGQRLAGDAAVRVRCKHARKYPHSCPRTRQEEAPCHRRDQPADPSKRFRRDDSPLEPGSDLERFRAQRKVVSTAPSVSSPIEGLQVAARSSGVGRHCRCQAAAPLHYFMGRPWRATSVIASAAVAPPFARRVIPSSSAATAGSGRGVRSTPTRSAITSSDGLLRPRLRFRVVQTLNLGFHFR